MFEFYRLELPIEKKKIFKRFINRIFSITAVERGALIPYSPLEPYARRAGSDIDLAYGGEPPIPGKFPSKVYMAFLSGEKKGEAKCRIEIFLLKKIF